MKITIKSLLTKRFWIRAGGILLALIAGYICLLNFPEPFFHWSVSAANFTLYSDRPFSPDGGRMVLELARTKLESSPLYIADQHYRVFICNTPWRRRLLFGWSYRVGGINYYPITSNVFIRESLVDEDQVIGPSGKPAGLDRPLDYYIAHEITHTLDKKAIGWTRHSKLPRWVREGYPDYVGKGSAFNYAEAEKEFVAGAPEMDPQKSGLYLRYNLFVTCLLDKQHWTVTRLLEAPEDEQKIEQAIQGDSREQTPQQP